MPYGPDASALVPVAVSDGAGGWTYKLLTNAEIAAAAAIAYSKLNLAGSIVNGDVASGAAIAYAKLALAAAIKDSDIATSQNLSKLAAVTGTPNGTKFLRDDGSWQAVAGGAKVYRKNTAKQVVSSITETDLLNGEITLAANDMGATSFLRFMAKGDWLQNSGGAASTPRFKLKLGATTLIDTGVLTAVAAASASRWGWRVSAHIGALNATNSQDCWFEVWIQLNDTAVAGVAFTTGEGHWDAFNEPGGHGFSALGAAFNTSAVDMTASQALVLSVINGANSATYDVKLTSAFVEIL